jgi:hypothetical protein
MDSVITVTLDVGTLVRNLGEERERSRAQLAAVLAILGPNTCAELLRKTDAVETTGGLKRRDGARRSRGGVFFYLARERLSRSERRIVFGCIQRRLPRLSTADVVAAFDVNGARRIWSLDRRRE